MFINNEEHLLLKKINDKAYGAFYNGYPSHTEFLDLHEQGLFISQLKDLPPVGYQLFGGYDESERKCIVFYPDGYEKENLHFPLKLISIQTSGGHFTENLTHRDYLGALMHLGIERYKMGDILCNEHGAFVFCMENIADFIHEQLFMVKKTSVSITITDYSDFVNTEQRYEIIKGTVSSIRLDSIIKLGFSLSRGNALELIKAGKAFVNSRLSEKGSMVISEGSVISLRGFGKLKLKTIGDLTKKGRTYVVIDKYK